MANKKITEGQTVFVVTTGNRARYRIEVFPAKVKSVGKKFFVIEAPGKFFRHPFRLDNLQEKTEFTSDYQVYESEQDYINTTRKPDLIKKIINKLNELSVDELEIIYNRVLTSES